MKNKPLQTLRGLFFIKVFRKRKMPCSAEKTEQGENFTCKEENPKLTSPPTLEVMNMEKSKKL